MNKLFYFLFFSTTFLLSGEVIIDSPKKITREWEEKVFGIKYNVTTLDKAVNEMTEGILDDIFDKAFIQRIKSEIEKHPSGEYVEYWPNGKIKARLPYKNRKAHGHIHGWHQNGRDAFKGYFKNGLKQGIHITFFPGEKRRTNKARLLTFNEEGMLDGDQLLNHFSGKLWIAAEYKHGNLNGPLEGWDNKDEYFLAAVYKNGELQKELPKNGPPPERADMRYVNEVTREFIDIAEKEFGLRACGTGASMPFDIELISANFSINKKGTHEEARNLMVLLKEKFAEVVNRHEKIRPYLREYPFTPERADINVSFCDKQGVKYQDGSINYVLVGSNNHIYYYSANVLYPNKEREVQEPYEDAVKIVHWKKNSCW